MKYETNKIFKRAIMLMSALAMLILVAVVVMRSDKADAATKTSEKVKFDQTEYKMTCKKKDHKNYNRITMVILGTTRDSEDESRVLISNVKCTNKNFKVKKNEYQSIIDVYCKDKFAGQSGEVSCKVNGVELKATVSFLKYQNPFREFSIGGVDMKQKFNNKCGYAMFYPYTEHDFTGEQEVRIRMKSGWRIKYFLVGDMGSGKEYYRLNDVTLKKIIKTYSFENGSPDIMVRCYNQKQGILERNFEFTINVKIPELS